MSAELSSSPTPGPAPARRRTAWGRELAAFCAIALFVLLAVSAGTVLLRAGVARLRPPEEAGGPAERLAAVAAGPALAQAVAGGPGRGGGVRPGAQKEWRN